MAKRPRRNDEITATDPALQEGATNSEGPRTAGDSSEPQKPEGKTWPAAPEPYGIRAVALSADNDGPVMRLLRSNKYQQMQIQFDDKPDEAVRARLNADGWKWRTVEKVWTKQLDPEARWRTQADAEAVFKELADAIRAERGLAPTWEAAR
jgi:hypothetical protein